MSGVASFVLDLEREAALQRFDRDLYSSLVLGKNAEGLVLKRTMRDMYASIFLSYPLRKSVESYVERWADDRSHPLMRQRLGEAHAQIRRGRFLSLDAAFLALVLASRRARWSRLASNIGLRSVPTHLVAYRLLAGEEVVRQQSVRWHDPLASQRFPFPQNGLASWSLLKGSEREGALFFLFRNARRSGVLFKTIVAFENSIFDKWVDDAAFATIYPREHEVVLGSWAESPIICDTQDVIAYWNGKPYGYTDRAALLAEIQRH